MADNYSAWNVDLDSFNGLKNLKERIKFLINFAILAPSSHNSQPWEFIVEDDTLFVKVCLARSLPASDPDFRQLFISIGCAIQNILTAADYYGLLSILEYFPHGGKNNFAAKIKFSLSLKKFVFSENHLIHCILRRFTDRGKYDFSAVIPMHIYKLAKFLSEGEIQIDLVSNSDKRRVIANCILDAIGEAMSRDDFRFELSAYVKNNYTRAHIGMPGFTLGIPGPFSLVAPTLIKHFNLARLSRNKDEELLRLYTPIFGIISTAEDDKYSWIRAGAKYQRLALEAERINLKTAIMAAPIEIGNYYQGLQDVLNTRFRPQLFFRMGYSNNKIMHSPRLNISEVISSQKVKV